MNQSSKYFIINIGFYKTLFLLKILLIFHPFSSYSQLRIDTTSNSETYKMLFWEKESGIIIENFVITGHKYAVGYFQNYCKDLEIEKGIILSTGNVMDVYGPNDKTNNGVYFYAAGDKELSNLSNGKSFDAIILEFDFIPNTDSISFNYVFASEEYPEYVKKGLNDIFAFFLSKQNCLKKINLAKLPKTKLPITVDNINQENNNQFFISNTNTSSCLFNYFQFDGLSKKLSAGYKVLPYHKYHLKLCISDVGDGYFDSAVLLQANSFRSSGNFFISEIEDTLKNYLDKEPCIEYIDSNRILFIPTIEFEFNSFNIKEDSYKFIDRFVQLLQKYFDLQIEINGFSDNIGSQAYNIKLSYKRAENVASYLFSKGIHKTRIKFNGYGEHNPVADNNSSLGRMKNRRVSFMLIKNK